MSRRRDIAVQLLVDGGIPLATAEKMIPSPVITPDANVHIWAFNDAQVLAFSKVLAIVTEEEIVAVHGADHDAVMAVADVLETIGSTVTLIEEKT